MPFEKNEQNRPEKADDHISWRYQDKTYNELFRKWRSQHKDEHGFFYVSNPNERTYKEGFGFVRSYPEAAETASLRNVYNILGMTILFIVGIDLLYLYAIPLLLSGTKADIFLDVFTGSIYGNDWLIIGLYSVFEVIKRLIPFIYCHRKLNMPLRVMVPLKVANKPLFLLAVPAVFLSAGICAAITMFYGAIMDHAHFQPVNWIYLPDSPLPFAASLFANIILMPVVSEIYIRGPITQLLRQFGDGSAIIFTAALTTMITYNLNHYCYVFVTSVVIGYFVLRTGSVLTGVIMRVAARAVSCGLYMMSAYLDEKQRVTAILTLIIILVITGLAAGIFFMVKNSDKLGMMFSSRYLTLTSKALLAFTSVPMILGMALLIIINVLHVRFNF